MSGLEHRLVLCSVSCPILMVNSFVPMKTERSQTFPENFSLPPRSENNAPRYVGYEIPRYTIVVEPLENDAIVHSVCLDANDTDNIKLESYEVLKSGVDFFNFRDKIRATIS